MNKKEQAIKILWTGGMDSTFRLIQLALVYKMVVQPYYIIDHRRNSILCEIRAMESILNSLFKKFPDTKFLILPTIFKEKHRIKPNKEITDNYFRLRKIVPIGSQYEWLPRFCADEGINDIELSLERNINDEDNRILNMLMKDMDKIETDYEGYFKLKESEIGKDTYTTFGYFRFPLFDQTKLFKYNYSIEKGFDSLMRQTWFCLMPTRSSKPCGKCHPCSVVYKENLSWRLPLSAKFRYHTWPTLRKIAKMIGLNK